MARNRVPVLVAIALLAGCATAPTGPRVTVMPPPGKPFEQFAAEDRLCRTYAEQSVGLTPAEASGQSVAGAAVAGTVIGAAAGAAIGGGHEGAATGAGVGLITGTAVGARRGAYSAEDVQRRYDIAYEQCMYAKGNLLPGASYRRPPAVIMQPQGMPAPYPPPPPPPR